MVKAEQTIKHAKRKDGVAVLKLYTSVRIADYSSLWIESRCDEHSERL